MEIGELPSFENVARPFVADVDATLLCTHRTMLKSRLSDYSGYLGARQIAFVSEISRSAVDGPQVPAG